MSTHYSGERVLASMRAKSFVVQAVLQHAMAVQMSHTALPPDSLRWPGFSGSRPRPSPAATDGKEDLPLSCPSSPEVQESSSSSEDAGSTSSADSAHECLLDEVAWLRQRQKVHVVRERDLDSRPVPWCRAAAFAQDPSAQGNGFTQDLTQYLCQKCLRSMPRGLSKALRAAQC